jgi:hypothetical protein
MSQPRVVVIEPVSSGEIPVLEARKMGWEVIVLSYNKDDRRLSDTCRNNASQIIELDTNDEQHVLEILFNIHKQKPISGVIAGSEFHVKIASIAASEMNLPGLPPSSVSGVRNKAIMRQKLSSNGVTVPWNIHVKSQEDILKMRQEIKFPAVVKAVESSGSVHVSRVDNLNDLRKIFSNIENDDDLDLGLKMVKEAVVEGYIEGQEYNVDGFVQDGKVQIIAITEKILGAEPHFVEAGHLTPAILDGETTKAINTYVQAVARALHINDTVFHAELRVGEDGPILMEAAARLSGDHIPEIIESTTGISLAKAWLLISIGKTVHLSDIRNCTSVSKFAGIFYILDHQRNLAGEIENWTSLSSMQGVVESEILVAQGKNVEREGDFRSRVAYVKAQAESYEQMAHLREVFHGN